MTTRKRTTSNYSLITPGITRGKGWRPLARAEPKKGFAWELVDPTVNLEFYEISSSGKKLPGVAAEFSTFLKKYIARWGKSSPKLTCMATRFFRASSITHSFKLHKYPL